jgi:hypothetical protein
MVAFISEYFELIIVIQLTLVIIGIGIISYDMASSIYRMRIDNIKIADTLLNKMSENGWAEGDNHVTVERVFRGVLTQNRLQNSPKGILRMLTRFTTILYMIGWWTSLSYFVAFLMSLNGGEDPNSWILGYAWLATWAVRYILIGETKISPFPTKAKQPESPES